MKKSVLFLHVRPSTKRWLLALAKKNKKSQSVTAEAIFKKSKARRASLHA